MPGAARVDRAERILRGFDDALFKQEQFVKALPEDIFPMLAATLTEQAKGVFYEKIEVNSSGRKIKRIYQKTPSPQAIELLLKLMSPQAHSTVMLEYMRGQALAQEIDAGASKAKVAQLLSQARLNNENADVFSKMLIDDELYTNTVKAIGTYAIGQLQAVPYTQMEEILAGGQEAYDKFHERFAQNVIDRLESLLDAGREVGVSKMLGIEAEE